MMLIAKFVIVFSILHIVTSYNYKTLEGREIEFCKDESGLDSDEEKFGHNNFILEKYIESIPRNISHFTATISTHNFGAKVCSVKVLLLSEVHDEDIDLLMEEKYAALETFQNSYAYVNTWALVKKLRCAYLIVEHHDIPTKPLQTITYLMQLMLMTVRDFVNRCEKLRKTQFKGFILEHYVEIKSDKWIAFKSMVQTTSKKAVGKESVPTNAIIIVQLASTDPDFSMIDFKYECANRSNRANYYLLKQAYINGRKAHIVVIELMYGDFSTLFEGLSYASATYAYFLGKTITDIKGPAAGIIEKIYLDRHCLYKNGTVEFALYSGTASTFKKDTDVFQDSHYSTLTPINEPKGFQDLSVFVKIVLLDEGRTNKYLKHEYEVIRYKDPFRVMFFCPCTIFLRKKIAILMHTAVGTNMLNWFKEIPENLQVPPEHKLPENV